MQLCDKVKRMKARYHTLEERPKGAARFKNFHEEKLFQVWEDIWGSGTKSSQPAAAEEESEDESAETRIPLDQVVKIAASQAKGGDSSSEDEDEDVAGKEKQKTTGLNQINSASKVVPQPDVVSPFISKPRLEFTPLHPKEDKRKVIRTIEEEAPSGDQLSQEVVAKEDGSKGDVVLLANEHLKRLRDETRSFLQELRGSCFQAMEEQRNVGLTGGLGNFAFAGNGFGFPGILDGFSKGGGSQASVELQKKWREHKIQEFALLSERLRLLQEQCQLQMEELKLQNQRVE